VIERIQLRPENVAFFTQGLNNQFLLSTGVCVFGHVLQRKISIDGSLIEPSLEVIQAPGKPGIKLAERAQPQGDEISGEQFRERRPDGFEQRAISYQIKVSVNGIAYARKDLVASDHSFPAQTRGFGQPQPAFDTPFRGDVSVMIENALAPGTTEDRIITARE
jgi:hypothetical protein